jgi:hypothetical protein
MSKLNFLTFSNKKFMNNNRIIEQAKNMNVFNNIYNLNEDDISEFILKHNNFFKKYYNIGYGLWLWKPKVILDTLHKMNDDDILLYCDGGIFLNKDGIERFNEYINILKNDNINIVTFSTSEEYLAQNYVKNDAIMSYYPEFNNRKDIYNYAGLMIIKKSIKTINLIEDWLKLCENYNFLDKSPSCNFKDTTLYLGNDCDNGLFNLCLIKHNMHYSIYPDETNIYIDNKQIIHVLTKKEYINVDWSLLNKYPFQYRRITPKIYN